MRGGYGSLFLELCLLAMDDGMGGSCEARRQLQVPTEIPQIVLRYCTAIRLMREGFTSVYPA